MNEQHLISLQPWTTICLFSFIFLDEKIILKKRKKKIYRVICNVLLVEKNTWIFFFFFRRNGMYCAGLYGKNQCVFHLARVKWGQIACACLWAFYAMPCRISMASKQRPGMLIENKDFFVCVFVYSVCVSIFLSVYLSVCLCIRWRCLCIYLPDSCLFESFWLHICLSICLNLSGLPICLPI